MQKHKSVLLKEVLEILDIKNNQKYLDCTFGGGGHTRSFLEFNNTISVIGLDCDPEVSSYAQSVISDFGNRFLFYDLNYCNLDQIKEENFNGILFDLGVSSFQLDTRKRGFSFRKDAYLDLRMNPRTGISAADFLQTASSNLLIKAIRDFGEEIYWRRIVNAIQYFRGSKKLTSTISFSNLICNAIGSKAVAKSRIHPATKTFQGLRIAVNKELTCIQVGLQKAFKKLASGGTMIVISFHSLEDRLVKRFMRGIAGLPEHANDSRAKQEREILGKLIFNKPIQPKILEINENLRSRSAKLRALRKN